MECWVVSDGKAGMENQAIGLAEALGVTPVVKRVTLRTPWRQLTPWLRVGLSHAFGPPGDRLAPPWPDLVIGCGRAATAGVIGVRKASRGRTFGVYIQDPKVSPRHFDLVVVPRHDRLRGENVVVTRGALHLVTQAKLAAEAERLRPSVAHLPRPLVAVLIGGRNAVYPFTGEDVASIAERLAAMARATGCGLLVTTSRRTGAGNEAILRRRLEGLPAVTWDGRGPNPYLGWLGLADAIVVTGDSISMMSEACTTGKPVYIAELPGKAPKFERFRNELYADGIARPFTGELARWSYDPLDETGDVAREIRARMAARAGGNPGR